MKRYINAGVLKKVLTHCNDEDEICIEFPFDAIRWAEHEIDKHVDSLAALGGKVTPTYRYEFRINKVYHEGEAVSSWTLESHYKGYVTFELEWDTYDRSKFDKEIQKARDYEQNLLNQSTKNK